MFSCKEHGLGVETRNPIERQKKPESVNYSGSQRDACWPGRVTVCGESRGADDASSGTFILSNEVTGRRDSHIVTRDTGWKPISITKCSATNHHTENREQTRGQWADPVRNSLRVTKLASTTNKTIIDKK